MTREPGAPAPRPNAPLIVTALFGKQDQAWLEGLRREHFPAERNLVEAHLTLFHHLPPSAAEELKTRLAAATRGVRAPAARAAGLISLDRGVAIRVDAPVLAAIRNALAESFAGLLMPQDAGGWRPHVTIQNKVSPSIARLLLGRLTAEFHPRTLELAGLASWWYRGGGWEPHSRHMFA